MKVNSGEEGRFAAFYSINLGQSLRELSRRHKPFRQARSGEDILTGESPTQRYGAGVLYPLRVPDDRGDEGAEDDRVSTLCPSLGAGLGGNKISNAHR